MKFKYKSLFLILLFLIICINLSMVSASEDNNFNNIHNDSSCNIVVESINEISVESSNSEDMEIPNIASDDTKTFSDIQNLINAAENKSVIELSGTYIGNGTPICINKTLTIKGGPEGAILDGNNLSRVFYVHHKAPNVIIENLQFINCKDYDGGAVYWFGVNGTLRNCTFINCYSCNPIDNVTFREYGSEIVSGDNNFSSEGVLVEPGTVIDFDTAVKLGGILKKYVKLYKELPSFICVDGYKFTAPQISFLLVSLVDNIQSGNKNNITMIQISNPSEVSGKEVFDTIYKANFTDIARNILSSMNANNQAPSYIHYYIYDIPYNVYTMAFAGAIAFYEQRPITDLRLPNYILFTTADFVKVPETDNFTFYLTSDNIKNKTEDAKTLKQLATTIESMGYNVVIVGIGPDIHNKAYDYGCIGPKSVLMCCFGGVDVGIIEEWANINSSFNKNYKGARILGTWFTSPHGASSDVHGYVGRAWDADYGFPLDNPAQYMIKNGISFIEAPSLDKMCELLINHEIKATPLFEDSSYICDGGAVYWAGNNGILTNCSFTNCHATTRANDVYWFGSNGTMIVIPSVSAHFGDIVDLVANVGYGVTGKITFYVDGVEIDTVDIIEGVASCKYVCSNKGDFIIKAIYTGDDLYLTSNSTGNISIDKVSTSISGSDLKISAYTTKNLVITLNDANGNILAGKKVVITLNGKNYTRTTDSKGQAKLAITSKNIKVYTATIKFAGEDNYLATSKSVKVNITAAYVTVADIIKAAKSLKSYSIKNKKLPATIKVGAYKLTHTQLSYLMAAAIKKLNAHKKVSTKIKVINVKATTSNKKVSRKVYKFRYMKIVNTIYKKAVKGTLPKYVKYGTVKIRYNAYTYSLAKILAFYSNKNRLPHYCVFKRY